MKPYTEVYDRWSFMNPDLPNPAVGGYPGAIQFAGFGDEQLPVPDADQDLLRQHRPAPRRRLQPERSHGAARLLRDHVLAARRRRRPRRRAQRHRHARLLGQRVVPEPERLRAGLQLEQRRARRIPTRRSSIRRSTPASSPGAATGGGVTYGDPEIGGRPPRYQNWNVGAPVRADVDDHGRRRLRRQPRRLPRRQRPRLLRQPARSALPRARQPADAARPTPPTSRRRRPSSRTSRCPTPNFSGTIGQMLRPFPQYSGVTDVYGNVAQLELPLAAADRRSSGAGTA